MRDEFVRRRGWLDDERFIDLLGASSLIPGPTSSELAMHIGYRRGGWPGLIVAGLAFLLPAVVLVGILAWLYVEQGSRPEVGLVLATVGPVVLAVIAHAALGIGRATLRGPLSVILLGLAVVAVLGGVAEIVVLLGAGLLALVAMGIRNGRGRPGGAGMAGAGHAAVAGAVPALAAAHAMETGARTVVPPTALAAGAASLAAGAAGWPIILFEMGRVGAVLFGSGYVLVALFQAEFVDRLGWITQAQLLDAMAVGQATPGPLFSTATFVGYLAAGPSGAVAATVGIFAPAFVAVAVSIPILERMRASTRARAFLVGVNAATVGLLAVVALQLAAATIVVPLALVIAGAAWLLLLRGVGAGRLMAGAVGVGVVRVLLAA